MIVLTYHAVEQYVSRFRRELSADAAWKDLEQQLPYANRLQIRSLRGDTVWRLPSGAYLVTKKDDDGDVAVTVLKNMETRNDQPTDEELAMALEALPIELRLPGTGETRTYALTVAVSVTCTLGADNEPIVKDKIRNAIEASVRSAMTSMQRSGVGKAKVGGFELQAKNVTAT